MAALSNAALKYAMFANTWPLTVVAGIILAVLTIAIAILFVRTLHLLLSGQLLLG